MIARYRYYRSPGELSKPSANATNAHHPRSWVVWWRKVCSPRRSWTCDHLQHGKITWQVTNAAAPIKAMKERGWDRRLVAPQRGPTTKAEPSVGGFPPFVPAFRFFCVPSTIATAETGSFSRDFGANRSVLLCVKAKIKKIKRAASPLFISTPRSEGEIECYRCRRWMLLVIARRMRESETLICESYCEPDSKSTEVRILGVIGAAGD